MQTVDHQHLRQISERVLAAWNAQDVDAVVACFTADGVYVDPNTNGPVVGRQALSRYLRRVFAEWRMTWTSDEQFALEDGSGLAGRLHATLRPKFYLDQVEFDGFDLVLLDGDLIARAEVWFDRTHLGPALLPEAA